MFLYSATQALENDMAAIRSEHDTQNRLIQSQKSSLDDIISNLSALRFMGKEPEAGSTSQSQRATPTLEGGLTEAEADVAESSLTSIATEDGEETVIDATPSKSESEGVVEDNDIEMGEVQEDPRDKSGRKSRAEELEEGEATDASSELSEPPDD